MSQGKVIIFKFRNILSFQNWVTTATHFRILFWTSDSHFTFKFNLGRHPRKTAERMKTVLLLTNDENHEKGGSQNSILSLHTTQIS